MIKKFFLQNEYMFKKELYFVCNTNIFSIKIYLSNEIHIFYIFALQKKFFSVKKIFQYITFFPHKNIFSANNVHFVKNTNIFSENKIFF